MHIFIEAILHIVCVRHMDMLMHEMVIMIDDDQRLQLAGWLHSIPIPRPRASLALRLRLGAVLCSSRP